MPTIPEYAKGGVVSGDMFIPSQESKELVGALGNPQRGKTETILLGISDGCRLRSPQLDSYALCLGLHALGIPVEFKQEPERKCICAEREQRYANR